MCDWGTDKSVAVHIPPELSHTGGWRWKCVGVDACIADIVSALQVAGITTTGACCGHHRGPGEIRLRDGRKLIIVQGNAVVPFTLVDIGDAAQEVAKLEVENARLRDALKRVLHWSPHQSARAIQDEARAALKAIEEE